MTVAPLPDVPRPQKAPNRDTNDELNLKKKQESGRGRGRGRGRGGPGRGSRKRTLLRIGRAACEKKKTDIKGNITLPLVLEGQ